MAVLEKIRNNAGLVVGVVGLGLFSFVIGDALQSGNRFLGDNDLTVLSIDGEEVSYFDYERRINQAQEMQAGQLSDEQRMMLNNQLAQEYITEHALNKISDQIGLRVTGDEVYALLHGGEGVQPSRTAVQFFSNFGIDIQDATRVNDFITQMSDRSINALPAEAQGQMRQLQAQWQMVQKAIVGERKQEKLAAILSRSYKLTNLDLELASAAGTRTVELVRTAVVGGDVAAVTKEEVKAYYDKNKEAYRVPSEMTEIKYISMQVVPSSDDYKLAEETAAKAVSELSAAASAEEVERIARGYVGSNTSESYLTEAEISRLGLSAEATNFVKTAEVGQVYNTGLVDDRYTILKLIDRKSGIQDISIRYIVLDSTMSARVDSLEAALKAGADFAEMARQHSIDPQSKEQGGLLELRNELGLPDTKVTEFTALQIARQSGIAFDQLFKNPIGTTLVFGQPNARILVKSENPGAVVSKCRLAVVPVVAEFSAKTYDGHLATLNRILGEGGSFDDMATKAEREGFQVERSEYLSASSPAVGRIPSSRTLASWALNAEVGETTDKVFRLSSDYLAIATVAGKIPQGYAPVGMVEDEIKAAVAHEKRAEALAGELAAKGFTTLEEYATDLDTQVETLVGVNYLVRGSEAPAFNGKAMTTPLGQLSKPFVAGNEVMIIKPVSNDTVSPEQLASQSKQQERNVGYQLFSRAFRSLVQSLNIEDNRARFF